MVILLTGASGFIGRHLVTKLLAAGHQVVVTSRRHRHGDAGGLRELALSCVPADFTRDFSPADWLPRLEGIEVVINAVGIIREQDGQTFDAIHHRAPCALFAACATAGVRLVLQISALGADQEARSRYHLSKKQADDFLARLPLAFVIVQPSLVYGADGASARLFTRLASLPLLPRLGRGGQMVQPVHVDDAGEAIVALLDQPRYWGKRMPLVGPAPLPLTDFLARLRQAMGLRPTVSLPIPISLVRMAAAIGERVPHSLLDRETLQMLERGNTGDPAPMQALLGRPALPVPKFIAPDAAPCVRLQARLGWLLPILRLSLALVWIVTGLLSFGIYPVQDSYALLAPVGISGTLASVMLYTAATLDLAIGMAILTLRGRIWRRWLWLLQMGVMVFYSLIIAWKLPQFWLHPYGPMLKNLPMLAAIWLVMLLEHEVEGA